MPLRNRAGRRSGGCAPKGKRKAVERTDTTATFAPLIGACAKRGVPPWVGRDAAARGAFPIARFGRVIHVRWSDFDTWIESQMERGSR